MFKVYEFHWKAINRFQQKQKGKLKKAFSKLKLVGILFYLKIQNQKR